MNLFFSGGLMPKVEFDERLPKGRRYRLLSCHGAYVKSGKRVIGAMIDVGQPFEMMLDSGAFTAWTQGHEVELDTLIEQYDQFLDEFHDQAAATWLISLDKIPGERGRTASAAEIAEAIKISDQNFETLQQRYGDIVLPVFHQNESTERLHEVASMAPYICISPRNDLAEKSRRKWSREVHSRIPGKKTHGLAATGHAMMSQVPWGSVDSATWVLLAANGSILYGDSLRVMKISEEAGTLKDHDQHYRNLSEMAQKAILGPAEEMGFTLEGLEKDATERMIYNRVMMARFANAIPSQKEVSERTYPDIPLFDL